MKKILIPLLFVCSLLNGQVYKIGASDTILYDGASPAGVIQLGKVYEVNNVSPVASNVTFTGNNFVLQTLTSSYTYSDADGDLTDTPTYQWYRANDVSGTNESAISSATSSTYTLTTSDSAKYISVKITPVALTGTSPGLAVQSSRSLISGWDYDARMYLTNLSSDVSFSDWLAIDIFVDSLKSKGLWDKMYAIYPIMGISATDHKWNLKDPRDLDAAYRLTDYQVHGTGLSKTKHAEKMIDPADNSGNGTYLDTHFKPSDVIATNFMALSFYTTDSTGSTYEWAIGSNGAGLAYSALIAHRSDHNSYSYMSYPLAITSAHGSGFWVASRQSATDNKLYKDAVQVGSDITNRANAPSTKTIDLLGTNANGTHNGVCIKNCLFASISSGLSSADVTNLNTLVKVLKPTKVTYPYYEDSLIQFKNPVTPIGTQIYLMDVKNDMKFGQTVDSLVFDVDHNDTYQHKIAFTDTVNFANIFDDGSILIGTVKDSLWYSADSLRTLIHKDLLNSDGSIHKKLKKTNYYTNLSTPVRFDYGDEEITIFGNYTGIVGAGLDAPAMIYYTHLNTLKIAYIDTSTITHNHSVAICTVDTSWYMSTGDNPDGTMIRKLKYNKTNDTWTTQRMIDVTRGGGEYKITGLVCSNDSLIWCTDNAILSDTSIIGVYKSKLSELNDTTKRVRVYKYPTLSNRLGLVRYGTNKLLMGGLNSTNCIHISTDNGKTWTADKLFGVTSGFEVVSSFIGPDDRGFYISKPDFGQAKTNYHRKIRLLIKPK